MTVKQDMHNDSEMEKLEISGNESICLHVSLTIRTPSHYLRKKVEEILHGLGDLCS